MKKYTVVGQNVYEEKRLPHTENILICIATTVENAIEIAASLNVIQSYQKQKQ